MRVALLLSVCLFSAGCAPKSPPKAPQAAGYAYENVKGPSVEEEIKFYEERLKKLPHSHADKVFLAQAYLTKAQAEDNDELFCKAEELAQEVVKVRPSKEAKLILASVSEGHHNFRTSYEICSKLYEQDPNDLGLRSMISNSLLEMGQVKEAEQWCQPLLKRAATASLWVHAARVAIYNGKDDEASKYLAAALKVEQPQERKASARIRSLQGDIDLRHGRLAQARQKLEESLKIFPRSLPALLALARLERREGHPDKALALLSQAYQYFHNPAILTEMGAMEERLGRAEAAQKLRQEAYDVLKEEVGNGLIGHARDLAKVLLDMKKPEEALKVLKEEQAYRRDHRNFELQAQALADMKKPKEALAQLDQAMAFGYQDPIFYLRAAELAKQAGDPRAAEFESKAKALDSGASLQQ
jgi:predicted Zn-dependent protease